MLQQALITIAVSVIAADQMLAHFGGLPEAIKKPPAMEGSFDLHLFGVTYPKDRMYMLFFAIIIGILLFAWVHRTRMGMIVRAGIDDRMMVSALGINIERVFAIAFFIGALLAGFGGTLGGTTLSLAPGQERHVPRVVAGRRHRRRHGQPRRRGRRRAAARPGLQLLGRVPAAAVHELLDPAGVRACS